MDYSKEQVARIWLQCAPMGAWNRLRDWRKHLGGPQQVWDVFSPDFYSLLGEAAYARMADSRAQQCGNILAQLEALNARALFLGEEDYPAALSRIPDPPDVLFVQGNLPGEGPAMAVVGARSATRYGTAQARRLGRELSQAGVTVVSGLARGIDASAHLGALEGGSPTVAVLGSGLGCLYPPENKDLAQRILDQGGAIISELAPDAEPHPYHFPVRNRIISGLSAGVLLIEARLKSGTHSTVNHAIDQGREVFALPGNVDAPGSELPLQLLRDGAVICTCGQDILSFMGWGKIKTAQSTFLPEEKEDDPILRALRLEEKTLEELIEETGIPAPQLSAQLTILEISGKIERRAGRAYARCRIG